MLKSEYKEDRDRETEMSANKLIKKIQNDKQFGTVTVTRRKVKAGYKLTVDARIYTYDKGWETGSKTHIYQELTASIDAMYRIAYDLDDKIGSYV